MNNNNPFMPQQPNHIKAPLLVGTVMLGIGIFLFSYVKWSNILISTAVTIVSTAFLYVLLRNFLLKRIKSTTTTREFNPRRRRK